MKITRDVVSDLWPLYESGEASPDTRAVVDEFLGGDPEFARLLKGMTDPTSAAIAMPPDREVAALARTRDLVHGGRWLRALRLIALALTGLAVARVMEDTDWTSWPKRSVATGVAAFVVWTAYLILLRAQRSRALRPSQAAPAPFRVGSPGNGD
jgi:hypothetical protein